MELIASRDGEAVACAYGCTPTAGGGLRAGMLFVQAGLSTRLLDFLDPSTSETRALLLPEAALDLPRPARAYDVPLEQP